MVLKNIFRLNLPYNLEITVFKKNKIKEQNNFLSIHFHDKNMHISFWIDLKKNFFQINQSTNCIYLKHTTFSFNYILQIHSLKVKFIRWDSLIYLKIKFKGKGYKIKYFKKNQIMIFFFGRSHICVFKFKNVGLVKLGKYKFIFEDFSFKKLTDLARNILRIRPINIYTLRGLRKSKQIIFKRKGKKSSYF